MILFINNNLNPKYIITYFKAEFNQNKIDQYYKEQKKFCNEQKDYYNKNIEDKIRLAKAHLNNKNFNMYVYNENNFDYVSYAIRNMGGWDTINSIKISNALEFYSNILNVKHEDIYIIDLGANIGWFSFYLAKFGYNILSFEVSKINDYILRKNYCLNNDSKIIIINKGIYNTEKKCLYYIINDNVGNGLINCKTNSLTIKNKKNIGEVEITKLSNYIPYLSTKNIAFIKLDIEGAEGQALTSGIDLIIKYHVPFLYLEFSPKILKLYETEPRDLLLLFNNNGYNMSDIGFFENNYLSIEEIMNIMKVKDHINLFIVYFPILQKYKKRNLY